MEISGIKAQIQAIAVYQFLNLYTEMEGTIKDIFLNSLDSLSNDTINYLYFIYGGRIGTNIEYENSILKLREIKYKDDEKFKAFTANELIKIDRNRTLFDKFPDELKSAQMRMQRYGFKDSILKLISMRNRIAHELSSATFKEADIIEILSDEKIIGLHYPFLEQYDVSIADDFSKQVISNYYYMEKIEEELKEVLSDLMYKS